MNAEQNVADAPAMRRSAARGDPEPTAVGGAVHRGDDDLRRGAQVHGEVGHELLAADAGVHVRVLAGRGRRAEVLEVEAGAEAATGAGEDGDPALGVGTDRVERVVQVGGELEVERVEPLGPVQRDLLDVRRDIADVDGDARHRRAQPITRSRMTFSCSASRPPTSSVVTGLARHASSRSLDARRRADDRDLVGELLGHRGDRLVALAREEEVLDLVGLFLEAHPRHQLGVVVLPLGAHAADVEAERRLAPASSAALTSSVTVTVHAATRSRSRASRPRSWSA